MRSAAAGGSAVAAFIALLIRWIGSLRRRPQVESACGLPIRMPVRRGGGFRKNSLRLAAPLIVLLPLLAFAGCDKQGSTSVPVPATPPGPPGKPKKPRTLADARRGFQTKLTRQERDGEPAPEPPADLFQLVRYDSPA